MRNKREHINKNDRLSCQNERRTCSKATKNNREINNKLYNMSNKRDKLNCPRLKWMWSPRRPSPASCLILHLWIICTIKAMDRRLRRFKNSPK